MGDPPLLSGPLPEGVGPPPAPDPPCQPAKGQATSIRVDATPTTLPSEKIPQFLLRAHVHKAKTNNNKSTRIAASSGAKVTFHRDVNFLQTLRPRRKTVKKVSPPTGQTVIDPTTLANTIAQELHSLMLEQSLQQRQLFQEQALQQRQILAALIETQTLVLQALLIYSSHAIPATNPIPPALDLPSSIPPSSQPCHSNSNLQSIPLPLNTSPPTKPHYSPTDLQPRKATIVHRPSTSKGNPSEPIVTASKTISLPPNTSQPSKPHYSPTDSHSSNSTIDHRSTHANPAASKGNPSESIFTVSKTIPLPPNISASKPYYSSADSHPSNSTIDHHSSHTNPSTSKDNPSESIFTVSKTTSLPPKTPPTNTFFPCRELQVSCSNLNTTRILQSQEPYPFQTSATMSLISHSRLPCLPSPTHYDFPAYVSTLCTHKHRLSVVDFFPDHPG